MTIKLITLCGCTRRMSYPCSPRQTRKHIPTWRICVPISSAPGWAPYGSSLYPLTTRPPPTSRCFEFAGFSSVLGTPTYREVAQ
jgi:hypothetical protein